MCIHTIIKTFKNQDTYLINIFNVLYTYLKKIKFISNSYSNIVYNKIHFQV